MENCYTGFVLHSYSIQDHHPEKCLNYQHCLSIHEKVLCSSLESADLAIVLCSQWIYAGAMLPHIKPFVSSHGVDHPCGTVFYYIYTLLPLSFGAGICEWSLNTCLDMLGSHRHCSLVRYLQVAI